MPTPERLRGGLLRVFGRGRVTRDIQGTPLSAATTTPETQPSNESSLERTAAQIRAIFKTTIPKLSCFPSGVHSKGVIYFDTLQHFDDQHGNVGGIIFAVDKYGELHIRKALSAQETPNEVWDIESATRFAASSQEVVDYGLPLMVWVKIRADNARQKSIIADRKKERPNDSGDTRCLTTDAVNIELAVLELSRLKHAA